MDGICPLYKAYMALRQSDYALCVSHTDKMLARNKADQAAFLLRTQCVIEESYFDEADAEDGALDELIDKTNMNNVNGSLTTNRLATSMGGGNMTAFRPATSTHTASGFVRPVTAAKGKPQTRTSTRLGTHNTGAVLSRAASRAASKLRTGKMSRIGTTSMEALASGADVRSVSEIHNFSAGNVGTTLQQAPVFYGRLPLLRRILPNFFLRIVAARSNRVSMAQDSTPDITPSPSQAISYLTEYFKEHGADWYYNDRLGRAFYLLGNYGEAERHLRAAVRASPRLDTYLKLASAIAVSGQPQSSLVILRDARERFRVSYAPALAIARLSDILQSFEASLSAYSECLMKDPSNIEAISSVAALLLQGFTFSLQKKDAQRQAILKSFATERDAIQLYKRLLMFRSSDPAIWCNIGICYLRDELYGEAFAYILTGLARLDELKRTSDVADMPICYDAERQRRLTADLWYNLGMVFLNLSDYHTAQECFEVALVSDPSHCDSLVNLGVLASIGKNDTRALALFSRALDIDMMHPIAASNRAVLNYKRGNCEKALADSVQNVPYITHTVYSALE